MLQDKRFASHSLIKKKKNLQKHPFPKLWKTSEDLKMNSDTIKPIKKIVQGRGTNSQDQGGKPNPTREDEILASMGKSDLTEKYRMDRKLWKKKKPVSLE